MTAALGITVGVLALAIVGLAIRLSGVIDELGTERVLRKGESVARDAAETALHDVSNELHRVKATYAKQAKLWGEERDRLITQLAKASAPGSAHGRIEDVSQRGS